MKRLHGFLAVMVVMTTAAPMVATAQQGLDKRVTIDVRATPPSEVFASVASALGCGVEIDQPTRTAGPVTLHVINVRARVALDAICDSIECRWRFDGRTLWIASPSSRAPLAMRDGTDMSEARARLLRRLPGNLQFTDVPIRKIVERIGEAAGVTVEIDHPEADRRVSVDVSNLPLLMAIRKVVAGTPLEHLVFVGVAAKTGLTVRVGNRRRPD